MTSQINFFTGILIVNIILSPLRFPFLGLEGNRKRPCHLHCLTDGQIWSSLMVEEPENLIIEVNGSTSELNLIDGVVFL